MTASEDNSTHGGSHLTLERDGHYILSSEMSFDSGVAGGIYGFGVEINHEPLDERCETLMTGATTIKSGTHACILELKANDNVSVSIQDTHAPVRDVVIHSANLVIMRIGG